MSIYDPNMIARARLDWIQQLESSSLLVPLSKVPSVPANIFNRVRSEDVVRCLVRITLHLEASIEHRGCRQEDVYVVSVVVKFLPLVHDDLQLRPVIR